MVSLWFQSIIINVAFKMMLFTKVNYLKRVITEFAQFNLALDTRTIYYCLTLRKEV